MSPSIKKVAKPKEISPETPPKTERPMVELPKDENELFDQDDDLITSTLPDFSIASEEKTPVPTVWDHDTETIFKFNSSPRW